MAGVDTEFDGEARPMPDLNIGYLPQEPQLDPTKTVREVVEEAVSVIKDAQARLDEVYAAYADPDADFDKLAAEQAKLEAILQASDGHNLERQLEVAADALRLPAWDAKVEHLSGGEKRRGNYSGWLEAKSDRLAQESKQQSAHEKAMKEELEWVRKGAKARQSKSKARLQRFEEMQSQEFQKRSETNEIYIPAGPRLGDKLACVDQSREDLDGSKTVFQQISDGSDQIRIGNYEIPSRTYKRLGEAAAQPHRVRHKKLA
eukprot:gene5926-5796_t